MTIGKYPAGYDGTKRKDDNDNSPVEDENKIKVQLQGDESTNPNIENQVSQTDMNGVMATSQGKIADKQEATKRIKFDTSEMNLLSDTAKELKVDLKSHVDLKNLPEAKELNSEQLNEVLADEKTKTLIKSVTEDPKITETLREGESIGNLTIGDFDNLEKKVAREKKNLIMWLGANESIRLHIWVGEKNNKSIYVEKEFWYRSIKKRDELKLNLLKSRLNSINIKHNLIANRPLNTLNEEEKSFLDYSSYMIQIADYKVNEYEARLRFGMPADDFAAADGTEMAFANLAYAWRQVNVPYYNAEQ